MPSLDAITQTLLGSDAAPEEENAEKKSLIIPLAYDDIVWKEHLHPRDEEGKFTEKGTGRTFVSPNIANLTFGQAQTELSGQRHQHLTKLNRDIDEQLGLVSRSTDVIGAWADGAENTLMVTARGNYDVVRAAAAIKGSITNQKQVLVFQPNQRGAHGMAQFELKGSLADIHNELLQNGLAFHTLEPTEDGAKVHILADNQDIADTVVDVANAHAAHLRIIPGNGEFIGTDLEETGTDTEQRADAQRDYARIIDQVATKRRGGGRIRDVWRSAYNTWRAATGETTGAAEEVTGTTYSLPPEIRALTHERQFQPLPLKGNAGHGALISSRQPTSGENLSQRQETYTRADFDAMRDSEGFAQNINLLRNAQVYPNLRPEETEGKTPDEIAEAAIKHGTANLKFLYERAPKELRAQGHLWYEGAHNIAKAKATQYDIPIQSAAGVYAALSPMKLWDMNVHLG
ncbi:MAG: hypothetical protein J2P37_36575, partial [Ktedonobacteraceae bacterium]|nr:hypothetical protein [Ktedonobacteraceae bacterium]